MRRLAASTAAIEQPSQVCCEVLMERSRAEIMMSTSVDGSGSEDVGVAYTTNEQVGTSAPAFNKQYFHQQQAYEEAEQRRHLQQQQLSKQQQSGDLRQAKLQRPAQLQERTSSMQSVSTSASSSRRPSAASSPLHSNSTTSLQAPESLIPAQNRIFAARSGTGATRPEVNSVPALPSDTSLRRPSRESGSSFNEVQSSSATLLNQHGSTTTSASLGAGGTHDQCSSNGNGEPGAQFSVEVIAPSFDQRGYPVFSGRAARIRGVLRTKVVRGCEVIVRVSVLVRKATNSFPSCLPCHRSCSSLRPLHKAHLPLSGTAWRSCLLTQSTRAKCST